MNNQFGTQAAMVCRLPLALLKKEELDVEETKGFYAH